MGRDDGKRWTKIVRWGLVPVAAAVLFLVVQIIWGLVVYSPAYVWRVLAWGESDAFDWQKFPSHAVEAGPHAAPLPVAEDRSVPASFARLAGVDDWEDFLAKNQTQSFLVIRDGQMIYQGYFNGTQPDSIVTSFSVAKSFTSALIGIAIGEGAIGGADDPITDYLPELAARDARFEQITIRDLLRMASGLDYQELRFPGLNGDDPLTTYYPDQRWLALNNTTIERPAGEVFQYNKYHPQLLGMILERATGMPVADYLEAKLWIPAGMVYDGSWSVDSVESDFEKMETGVNARAVDFARFGQIYLQGGVWEGTQVVPADWVTESTAPWSPNNPEVYYPPDSAVEPGRGYYGYMWWCFLRPNGYDFAAEGDKGQYIYVSPSHQLVIVRNGIDYGIPSATWMELFYDYASEAS
jgi:CubicO group peptidase (beta-lactamase class C family)